MRGKTKTKKTKMSALVLAWLALLGTVAAAKEKAMQGETLTEYVERMQQPRETLPGNAATGSLWRDDGLFAHLSADYKAAHVGDLITITVVQDITAQNTGNVSTSRTFNASSGISALAGRINTGGIQSIFSPNSSQTLAGKAQAATTSSLRTSLAGRVAAVLPSGALVIEAQRVLTMNNEKQTILVRGLVRPGDVGPNNTVPSNAIADLELELKGKGVLSDGTHPPNAIVRAILKIVGF